ncbi:ATP-binding protein [Streptomyces decoyicus]|uniref:ATP-binding protein n=1 Tax=Streptomyces decoyicus TaxID=249567 RepID=A0ABZ1F8H0_9ACTN|nr:ATP-binding protein [Streptomyces decoyicus]WSB66613.1 ATP-binding protein [Streptomyces decoyicus]
MSELVANAIRHTRAAEGQRIWLALHLLPNELICAATDPSPRPPELLSPDATADRGRGPHVVDNLSSSWGWSPTPPHGKVVWSTLPLHGTPRSQHET